MTTSACGSFNGIATDKVRTVRRATDRVTTPKVSVTRRRCCLRCFAMCLREGPTVWRSLPPARRSPTELLLRAPNEPAARLASFLDTQGFERSPLLHGHSDKNGRTRAARPLSISILHAAIRSVGPAPPSLCAKVIPSRARTTCGKRVTTPAGPAPKSRSASFRNFDDRAIGCTERRGYDRRVDGSRNTKG